MKVFIALISLFLSSLSFAQTGYHSDSQKALEQTQELLRSQEQRNQYIKNNKGAAQKADDNVNNLTRGNQAHSQELYSIASDVLAIVTEKAKRPNGEVDVEKMKKLMMEYQANPEAFYRQMTPEQKRRIKVLGHKIGPAPASQN